MTPMFDLCSSRVAANYAQQTGVSDPQALPPGTIATIINLLLPILLQMLGKCQTPTSPPTTGAKAMQWHCQNRSIMAHFQIRRQIRLNGGLPSGMKVGDVADTIIATGAASTPEEIQGLAEEMGE